MQPSLTRVKQKYSTNPPSMQFKNKEGETPCTVVLDLLVPCSVNISNSSRQSRSFRISEPDVADPDHRQPSKSAQPAVPGELPSILHFDPFLTFLDSNVAFYNLLSACALFCVKTSAQVDPFYKWTESCKQVVPMTREYPFADVITTDIPSWASKKLSSSGSFDPSAVMSGEFSYPPFFSSLSRIRLFSPPPHEPLADLPWLPHEQGNGALCRKSLRCSPVSVFLSSSA